MKDSKTFFNLNLITHFSNSLNYKKFYCYNDLRRILRTKKGFFNNVYEKDDNDVLKALNAFMNYFER